ncbi:MAG TPA: hypothetical protein VMT61_11825 [Candidatus Binataceae bacterium]|nr:hypothetical protein [Candidatus Binataceae bacterium]
MSFSRLSLKTILTLLLLLSGSKNSLAQSSASVLTHHYDYWRSGWNSKETTLTPYSLSSGSNNFGLIASVNNLDGAIFAQPLVVPNQQITCPAGQTVVVCEQGLSGVYEVVYIATNSNTLYAINAANGQILLQRNFGPISSCGGIVATPVIDSVSQRLYVMAHITANGDEPSVLHAVNLSDLTDAVPAYTLSNVNTTQTLTDGSTYRMIVAATCLRSALLLVNGNVYAGFRANEYISSDTIASGPTRGWVLGWNAKTLTPIPPLLTDRQTTSTNNFFLASIWMSGGGLASDGTSIYFSTGNSDPAGDSLSISPPNNIEESIVKVSSGLRVLDLFTPSDYAFLDANDWEIGSGGVMVIPNSSYVVGGGKDGRMFLLNSGRLGGFTPGGPDKVLDTESIGECWCAPSYFMGPDGIGRVVSSGGNSVTTWKLVQSTSAPPKLVQDSTGLIAATDEDPGFFTSVSSNNTGADYGGIIWAVGRPSSSSSWITLYAFNANGQGGTLPLIGQYQVGMWNRPTNANIVPVVANGKIYVASANNNAGILAIVGFLPQSGSLANVVITNASYSSATGLFSSKVKNLSSAATPAGTPIKVAYYVNGQFAGAGAIAGPLVAGASATISAAPISGQPPSGAGNSVKAFLVR